MWRFALALVALLCGPSQAAELNLTVGNTVRAPSGWPGFCLRHPADCKPLPVRVQRLALTQQTYQTILHVNKHVNSTIKQITDLENYGEAEYWTYPTNGRGDCEDLVILKKHLLRQFGFPPETLLITVVKDLKGNGHAVLVVRTTKGDYVLDNIHEAVLLWNETGYPFIKQQSQADPNIWVSLGTSTITGSRR